MAVELKSVYSTSIDQIGYDPEARELHVKWAKGKSSVYNGVPADVAQSVMNAWSVGEALHQMVKKSYPHRYTGG